MQSSLPDSHFVPTLPISPFDVEFTATRLEDKIHNRRVREHDEGEQIVVQTGQENEVYGGILWR